MRRMGVALWVVGAVGCGKDEASGEAGTSAESAATSAEETTVPAFDVSRPEQCAACHQAVVAEWESSLHRRAHTTRDPIFAAVHRVRSEREGAEAVAKNCANCHSPAGDSPELADLGVTCSTCHQTKAVDRSAGKMGFAAFVRTADNEIAGPHGKDIVAGAPHALAIAEPHVFDGSTLCLSCHEELKNKDNIASCSTGIEWRDGQPKEGEACVDCHMPWVEGPSGVLSQARTRHRSHAFIGPHAAIRMPDDPRMDLAKGALGLEVVFEGDTLKVTLGNKSRHAWPTGFPGRFAVVSLVGYDGDDREVWRNFTDDPMRQHPDAVLNKVYLDGEGQPTLAPYAKTLARDSRLKTDETRVLEVVVPAEVKRVEASVVSRLVAPPLAKMLGLGEFILGPSASLVRDEVAAGGVDHRNGVSRDGGTGPCQACEASELAELKPRVVQRATARR